MKLDDYKLIAARPTALRADEKFTEAVMNRITKPPKQTWLRTLKHSPAMLLLALAITIAIVSGTAYAVSLLWPKTMTIVTPTPNTGSHKTYSVSFDQCGKGDAAFYSGSTNYELRKSSKLTDAEVKRAMDAGCELSAIEEWASTTWPENIPQIDNSTPNRETKNISVTAASDPQQLVSIDSHTMVTRLPGGVATGTRQLPSDVIYIADGKQTSLAAFKPGDMVTYVTQEIHDQRNDASCSPAACSSVNTREVKTIKAVVRLGYTPQDYQRLHSDFIPLVACQNLATKDVCPSADSVWLLYKQGEDIYMGANRQEVAGKLVSHDAAKLVIKTSSGRLVTIHTDQDEIAHFNQRSKSIAIQDSRGMTDVSSIQVNEDDTLTVSYIGTQSTKAPTDIPSVDVMDIRLLIEINGSTVVKY